MIQEEGNAWPGRWPGRHVEVCLWQSDRRGCSMAGQPEEEGCWRHDCQQPEHIVNRTAPGAGPPGAMGRSLDRPAHADPAAGRRISRRLWVVLCLLFLTSSAISLTGVICLIGWIATL